MRILLSNDDGIDAPGLLALEEACKAMGGEVYVVAPQREMSGCSRSITLRSPLRIRDKGPQRWSINGTPTDCVYMACSHLLPEKPDLLISGVNPGPNMGDDVQYSGTVAAALEGTMFKVRSLAVSINSYTEYDYEAAATYAAAMGRRMIDWDWDGSVALNLNVPGRFDPERLEWKSTCLGRRDYGQAVVEKLDPRGVPYYWIGGNPLGRIPVEGSDIDALEEGFASLTPLKINYFHESSMRALERLQASTSSKGIHE